MINTVNYNYKRGFLRLTDECNRYVQLSHTQLIDCLNHQNKLQLKDDEFIAYVELSGDDCVQIHFERLKRTACLKARGLPWINLS